MRTARNGGHRGPRTRVPWEAPEWLAALAEQAGFQRDDRQGVRGERTSIRCYSCVECVELMLAHVPRHCAPVEHRQGKIGVACTRSSLELPRVCIRWQGLLTIRRDLYQMGCRCGKLGFERKCTREDAGDWPSNCASC
eukprot:2950426-Amphidinium_carterae.1